MRVLIRPTRYIVPTKCGEDLESTEHTRDAHIRVEQVDPDVPYSIVVDLFDSAIKNPTAAQLASRAFENSDRGAEEATLWLKNEGIDVVVQRGEEPKSCALGKYRPGHRVKITGTVRLFHIGKVVGGAGKQGWVKEVEPDGTLIVELDDNGPMVAVDPGSVKRGRLLG